MEVFGLLLSIPGAFFLTVTYRFMILLADPEYPWIRKYFSRGSILILGVLGIELLALVTLGAKRAHDLAGPFFEIARGLVFFLATPSLINLLIFRRPSRWYIIGPIGTVFAFSLVLLQFRVSDQVYGEKVERPYRAHVNPRDLGISPLAADSTAA